MTKKRLFYIGVFSFIIILSSGFKPFSTKLFPWFSLFNKEETFYTVPTRIEFNQNFFNFPFTGKTFVGFKESLAAKESLCEYSRVNTLGYLGKYQFGAETLKALGIRNLVHFLNNGNLQEMAFMANLARNKWELQNEILQYSGKFIAGVEITESGMLAAAHLGGVGSVKNFLRTNGHKKCRDSYGASVKQYMNDFGGYDITNIPATHNAKVKDFMFCE
jgi:hypothetical protein